MSKPATPSCAPPLLVVMGVSGCGKSTVAIRLAHRLSWPFVEGDDLHPARNIAKMRSGEPLTDADRLPWLARIADWIDARRSAHEPGIVTCSALKRAYRDRLAGHGPGVIFVYLKISPEVALRRSEARHGHFMPPSLIPSQFADLEEPAADEAAITADAEGPPEAILAETLAGLRKFALDVGDEGGADGSG